VNIKTYFNPTISQIKLILNFYNIDINNYLKKLQRIY